ncbi:GntR family transcriptional regulator [Lactiplantibacillus carotarum]|uniref:GntR family transcriptional regulator n=1 Tax=Lactiplantibacillus carotarum TaxID=2993456 RepID=UPI00298F0880|nr:GntR family transcriptional regulator [Lactiplantibacillus carotarum]
MPIPAPQPFDKITAKDRAYQKIRDWIIDGTLMPNEKLAETSLATAISVSRTPIREALLKLREDGFVTMVSGKVTRVATLNAEDAATLYEPMAAIEGLAAAQAAEKITAEQLQRLQTANETYQTVLASQSLPAILTADRAVHAAVLAVAANDYETQFSNILYGHLARFENYFFKQRTLEKIHRNQNHDALITALQQHDPQAAREAMTEDWLNTMRVFQTNTPPDSK